MRYFEIDIWDPSNNQILIPNFNGQPGFSRQPMAPNLHTYTSLNFGASVFDVGGTNPAAQRIEMDIGLTFLHLPGNTNTYIRVWGVGIQELAQSSNLQGLNITVYGGMAAGLPLANPAQAMLLVNAQVYQAFGQWLGTDQYLAIYMANLGSSPSSNQTTNNPSSSNTTPLPNTIDTPANLVFQWQPGTPLLVPLVQCLQTAYPQYTIVGAVDPTLVRSGSDATGFFQTLVQLASWINTHTLSMISGYAPALYVSNEPQYPGVSMTVKNNTITIQDGSTQANAKQIQFLDLIGQPTWSKSNQVQVTCVLRGDIDVGDFVTLPNGPGIITAGANGSNSQYYNVQPGNKYSSPKSGSIFTGTFQVTYVRHVGDSRNPDPTSWVTTLDMVLMSPPSQSTVASYPVLAKATV